MKSPLRPKFAAALLGSALALAACQPDHTGSGTWAEESRAHTGFDRIHVRGGVDVFIEVNPDAKPQVLVSGDDNLLEHISTSVHGAELEIESEGWLNPGQPLEVWVRLPNLRGIETDGGVRVVAWGIASHRLDVDADGAADITLAGVANVVEIETSGAAHVRAKALRGDGTVLDSSGATKAALCVAETLKVYASGAADVDWFGSGKLTAQDLSGAAEVSYGGSKCADFTPPVRHKGDKPCGCPDDGAGNGYVGDDVGDNDDGDDEQPANGGGSDGGGSDGGTPDPGDNGGATDAGGSSGGGGGGNAYDDGPKPGGCGG